MTTPAAEQLATQRKELVAQIDRLDTKFNWQELQKIVTQESTKKLLLKKDIDAQQGLSILSLGKFSS